MGLLGGWIVSGPGGMDCLVLDPLVVCTDAFNFPACLLAAWTVQEVGVECARDSGIGVRRSPSAERSGSWAGDRCVKNTRHGKGFQRDGWGSKAWERTAIFIRMPSRVLTW